MHPPTRVALAVVAAAVVVACGGGGGDRNVSVELIDFEINAPDAAPAGTTFQVENSGESVHNWTSTGGVFSTEDLTSGQSASVSIEMPGTYGFLCTIHPDLMTGTIEITP